MGTFAYHCVRQTGPGEGAAAALATVAQHHGLPLGTRELRTLVGDVARRLDLFFLPFAAARCGFEAVPLTGEFHQLPEVPRPNIVLLRARGGAVRYAVLFEIDADSALLGDPATGEVRKWAKDEFCKLWTGDAVQVLPHAETLSRARRELDEFRDPVLKVRRSLGLTPPYGKKALFALGAGVVVAAAAFAAQGVTTLEALTRAALGLCLLFSVGAWLFAATCKGCSQAANLVGALPLAPLGVFFYGAVFGLRIFGYSPALTSAGLFGAAGIHVYLAGLLLRSRMPCLACFGAAVAVLSAVTLSALATPSGPTAWDAAAGACGLLTAALVVPRARKLFDLRRRDGAYRLAARVFAQAPAAPPGHARLIVYKRANCSFCAFYETVLRRALAEDFGDAVLIEERDAAREKVAVPLFLIRGSLDLLVYPLAAEVLYPRLQGALRAALNPELSALKEAGGIYVLGERAGVLPNVTIAGRPRP
jgi:hypothetical protein